MNPGFVVKVNNNDNNLFVVSSLENVCCNNSDILNETNINSCVINSKDNPLIIFLLWQPKNIFHNSPYLSSFVVGNVLKNICDYIHYNYQKYVPKGVQPLAPVTSIELDSETTWHLLLQEGVLNECIKRVSSKNEQKIADSLADYKCHNGVNSPPCYTIGCPRGFSHGELVEYLKSLFRKSFPFTQVDKHFRVRGIEMNLTEIELAFEDGNVRFRFQSGIPNPPMTSAEAISTSLLNEVFASHEQQRSVEIRFLHDPEIVISDKLSHSFSLIDHNDKRLNLASLIYSEKMSITPGFENTLVLQVNQKLMELREDVEKVSYLMDLILREITLHHFSPDDKNPKIARFVYDFCQTIQQKASLDDQVIYLIWKNLNAMGWIRKNYYYDGFIEAIGQAILVDALPFSVISSLLMLSAASYHPASLNVERMLFVVKGGVGITIPSNFIFSIETLLKYFQKYGFIQEKAIIKLQEKIREFIPFESEATITLTEREEERLEAFVKLLLMQKCETVQSLGIEYALIFKDGRLLIECCEGLYQLLKHPENYENTLSQLHQYFLKYTKTEVKNNFSANSCQDWVYLFLDYSNKYRKEKEFVPVISRIFSVNRGGFKKVWDDILFNPMSYFAPQVEKGFALLNILLGNFKNQPLQVKNLIKRILDFYEVFGGVRQQGFTKLPKQSIYAFLMQLAQIDNLVNRIDPNTRKRIISVNAERMYAEGLFSYVLSDKRLFTMEKQNLIYQFVIAGHIRFSTIPLNMISTCFKLMEPLFQSEALKLHPIQNARWIMFKSKFLEYNQKLEEVDNEIIPDLNLPLINFYHFGNPDTEDKLKECEQDEALVQFQKKVNDCIALSKQIENYPHIEKKKYIVEFHHTLAGLYANNGHSSEGLEVLIVMLNFLASFNQMVKEQETFVQIKKDVVVILEGLHHYHEYELIYRYLKQFIILGWNIQIDEHLAQEVADEMLNRMTSSTLQEFLDRKCVYEEIKINFTEEQNLQQLKKDQPYFVEQYISFNRFPEAVDCTLQFLSFHLSLLILADKLLEHKKIILLTRLLNVTAKLFEDKKMLSRLYLSLVNLIRNEPILLINEGITVPVFYEAEVLEKGAVYLLEHQSQKEREEKINPLINALLLFCHEDRWGHAMSLLRSYKIPSGTHWEKVLKSLSDKKHAGRRLLAWNTFKEIYKDDSSCELRNILLNRLLGTNQCDPELISLLEEDIFAKSSYNMGGKESIINGSTCLYKNAILFASQGGDVNFRTLFEFKKAHCMSMSENAVLEDWVSKVNGKYLLDFIVYQSNHGKLDFSLTVPSTLKLLAVMNQEISDNIQGLEKVELKRIFLKFFSCECFSEFAKIDSNRKILLDVLYPLVQDMLNYAKQIQDRVMLVDVLKCYNINKKWLLELRNSPVFYLDILKSLPLLLPPISLTDKHVIVPAIVEYIRMENELFVSLFAKESLIRTGKQYENFIEEEENLRISFIDYLMDIKLSDYVLSKLLDRIGMHMLSLFDLEKLTDNKFLTIYKKLYVAPSYASQTDLKLDEIDKQRFTIAKKVHQSIPKSFRLRHSEMLEIMHTIFGSLRLNKTKLEQRFSTEKVISYYFEILDLYIQNFCFGNYLRVILMISNNARYYIQRPNEMASLLINLINIGEDSVEFTSLKKKFIIGYFPEVLFNFLDVNNFYKENNIDNKYIKKWLSLFPEIVRSYLPVLLKVCSNVNVLKDSFFFSNCGALLFLIEESLSEKDKKSLNFDFYKNNLSKFLDQVIVNDDRF